MIRNYANIPGLPATGLMDIAADPDGTLWIVDSSGRLLRFNPADLTVQVWPGVSNVRRVVMDATVTPRALYVSMGNQGLAVIRSN
jgi:streptogramin lyase